MLNNIFPTDPALIFSLPNILINLTVAFILCLIIALVYKYTHQGLSYSQSYVFTLILVGVIISAVMMVIGNSIARAFGAFGAFSIIRFRTVVKDTKDMAFIFLALAVGMACGTNNHLIAVLTAAVAIIIILVLTKIDFGTIRRYDYILNLAIDTNQTSKEVYRQVFDKYLKADNLLHVSASDAGKVLNLTFNVKFSAEKDTDQFSQDLSKISGVSNVNLVSSKSDIEY